MKRRTSGRPPTTRSPLICFSVSITAAELRRVERIVGAAREETGLPVSRSHVIRELVVLGLNEAEALRAEAKRKARQ